MLRCQELCILDFGARFDGVTDDTRAWAAALSEIDKQGGGKLLLPTGSSKTSRVLFLRNRTTIQGMGPGVTTIWNSQSDVFQIGRTPGPTDTAFPIGTIGDGTANGPGRPAAARRFAAPARCTEAH